MDTSAGLWSRCREQTDKAKDAAQAVLRRRLVLSNHPGGTPVPSPHAASFVIVEMSRPLTPPPDAQPQTS